MAVYQFILIFAFISVHLHLIPVTNSELNVNKCTDMFISALGGLCSSESKKKRGTLSYYLLTEDKSEEKSPESILRELFGDPDLSDLQQQPKPKIQQQLKPTQQPQQPQQPQHQQSLQGISIQNYPRFPELAYFTNIQPNPYEWQQQQQHQLQYKDEIKPIYFQNPFQYRPARRFRRRVNSNREVILNCCGKSHKCYETALRQLPAAHFANICPT